MRSKLVFSLYWQINDCWPVASWSGTDYFGRWKAMHYYATKFFNDVLVSPNLENGTINAYVISDLNRQLDLDLVVSMLDFNGSIIKNENKKIDIPVEKQEAQILEQADLKELTELGVKIEGHYKKPQDIEWAFYGGKMYILQSRPITTL